MPQGKSSLTLDTSPITGSDYHGWESACNSVRPGDWLTTRREPGNRADKNAIVMFNSAGAPVGYVRRGLAKELAPRLDAGHWACCLVHEVIYNQRIQSWRAFVTVFAYDPAEDHSVRPFMTDIGRRVAAEMLEHTYHLFPAHGDKFQSTFGHRLVASDYPAYRSED